MYSSSTSQCRGSNILTVLRNKYEHLPSEKFQAGLLYLANNEGIASMHTYIQMYIYINVTVFLLFYIYIGEYLFVAELTGYNNYSCI